MTSEQHTISLRQGMWRNKDCWPPVWLLYACPPAPLGLVHPLPSLLLLSACSLVFPHYFLTSSLTWRSWAALPCCAGSKRACRAPTHTTGHGSCWQKLESLYKSLLWGSFGKQGRQLCWSGKLSGGSYLESHLCKPASDVCVIMQVRDCLGLLSIWSDEMNSLEVFSNPPDSGVQKISLRNLNSLESHSLVQAWSMLAAVVLFLTSTITRWLSYQTAFFRLLTIFPQILVGSTVVATSLPSSVHTPGKL